MVVCIQSGLSIGFMRGFPALSAPHSLYLPVQVSSGGSRFLWTSGPDADDGPIRLHELQLLSVIYTGPTGQIYSWPLPDVASKRLFILDFIALMILSQYIP
ncbi:hypothetical protein XENOCAPTIV_003712 [Xenoophorus captivus]|uniref:Uncharacterized protein n=1 Tax=Xenoophorus captivus TaxID=1517983 RepID=A0ABV0S4Z6_9TELE